MQQFFPLKNSFWMCAAFKQIMNVGTLKGGKKVLFFIDNLFSAPVSLKAPLDCWNELGDNLEISVI